MGRGGFAVVLPDAPNGTSLTGERHLPAYADAIGRAIDFARSRAALPVWLIGTSAGTTAAVNGAAHLGSKVSGAVLTSQVTRRTGASGETIFDAEPGAIAVPVLVLGNEYDTCADTPPGDAPIVLSALTRSPPKELVMVTSGQAAKGSDPCQGDVAARLSRDRGYGGATHLRMDQSGRGRLNGRYRQLDSHLNSGANFLISAHVVCVLSGHYKRANVVDYLGAAAGAALTLPIATGSLAAVSDQQGPAGGSRVEVGREIWHSGVGRG
jgi:pimeloyl-ACP methyl ester carboxylesterase